jgi:hypothetical protein
LRCWSVDPSVRDSFEGIVDRLGGIDFKVTPTVDSRRVYKFLSAVGSDCGSSPQQNKRPGQDCLPHRRQM